MSKQLVVVIDEDGEPDDEFDPIEISEGEDVREVVARFLEKTDEEGLGDWEADTPGYTDTQFEPIIGGVFKATVEHHQVSSARFHFKVIEIEEQDNG